MRRTCVFFIVIGCCCSFAQEKSGGYIHGLIVGEYFYKTGGDAQLFGGTSQFSQPLPRDSSGFQIRRLHLFYDYTFSETFSSRIQFEGNEKSLDPNGRLSLYLKAAYLEWKNLVPGSSVYIGLVPTPTWMNVEGQWGYRSVEKTITDFRGLGSSNDMGVHLRGTLFSEGSVGYSLMVGNGNAQKPENNTYKKYYAMVHGSPVQHLSLEAYMDYEPSAQDRNRTTWKTFLSYQEPSLLVGAEIIEQLQQKQDSLNADCAPFGISLFSWYRLSDHWKVYGRIDYYDPNQLSSHTGFYEYFISLGVDYSPMKNIHLMPNIWINTFTDKSAAGRIKATDVVPRITFFLLFN
jgi:hypothetical protein